MKILYSINTWLAFKISEQYYGDSHYVWCSPFFNANGVNPPSSDPSIIYNTLARDVAGQDKHSAKIAQNRTGLIKGANLQLEQGFIEKKAHEDIVTIANNAQLSDFRPLIYAIPYHLVEKDLKPASIELKANFFSKEFIIEKLLRKNFDVIDISG